jgi:hypothetical protein
MRIGVHVDTHGLPEKLTMFTKVEARRAIRGAVGRAAQRGRVYVRAEAPVKTGIGRAGIRSSSVRGLSNTAVAKVYQTGAHAHIMRWQDKGTGERHTHSGAGRGKVDAQYFFERGSIRLEDELPAIMDAYIDAALAKSGLG